MGFRCACGSVLTEGAGELMANMDGGAPAMHTTFTCPSCARSYSRWVQRPLPRPGAEPVERAIWIPEEPAEFV